MSATNRDRLHLVAEAPDVEQVPFDLLVPHCSAERAPLVVVHGVSAGAQAYFDAFGALATRHQRALLVPSFERPRFKGYQRLRGSEGDLAAAHALFAALTAASRRSDVDFGRIDLVGFSGGAQFAHRFAMLFPGRVRRVVVAAAGWYTYIDPSRPFPFGSGPSAASGGRPVEADRFLQVPLRVMVGENDVKRDPMLRADEAIETQQGSHRLVRGLRWFEHLVEEAQRRGEKPRASFQLMPATGHSFRQALEHGGFGERTFAFLEADEED
jgi:pimeloyl-ACP methyl ester carboxylesterase